MTIARRKKVAAVLGVALIAAVAGIASITTIHPAPSAKVSMPVPEAISVEPIAGPSRVDYRRLEERIAALMQQPGMVGLAVGTVEQGQVRFVKGYGEVLAGSGVPVTPDTVFRWASLSKSVAAALIVKLAAERRLSLDDPVAAMGTTLTLPGDMSRVTVADVLSHRLGLVRNAWDDRLEKGEDPRLLRRGLATLPPYCAPSTCFTYQNIAFDTATEIVERTTGELYADAARKRLFGPLGMSDASVGRAGLQGAASWARPHDRNHTPATVNDNYYRVPAAGGVNSSIRDLLRWMRAQMGAAPTVLPADALDTMHRLRVPTLPNRRRGRADRALTDAGYGLGWRSVTYAGRPLVGHRGAVNGYRSLLLFDPADQSGIVMLWNSNHSEAGRLQLEFFDLLYGLPPTDWLELDDAQRAILSSRSEAR